MSPITLIMLPGLKWRTEVPTGFGSVVVIERYWFEAAYDAARAEIAKQEELRKEERQWQAERRAEIQKIDWVCDHCYGTDSEHEERCPVAGRDARDDFAENAADCDRAER